MSPIYNIKLSGQKWIKLQLEMLIILYSMKYFLTYVISVESRSIKLDGCKSECLRQTSKRE